MSLTTDQAPQLSAFLAKWQASGAAERANAQLFLNELCGLLGAVSRDPHAHDECVPDQQVLDDICRHASAPDFMVLPFGQLRGIVDSWSFTNQGRTRTLHLYDCNKLR